MAATEQIIRERKRADLLMLEGIPMGAALRIARAEIEREARLVEALKGCHNYGLPRLGMVCKIAQEAIDAYESEFAPPPRTVEQIAADIGREWRDGRFSVQPRQSSEPVLLLDELSAALKRKGA